MKDEKIWSQDTLITNKYISENRLKFSTSNILEIKENGQSAYPTKKQPLFHVSHQIINDNVNIFPTKSWNQEINILHLIVYSSMKDSQRKVKATTETSSNKLNTRN